MNFQQCLNCWKFTYATSPLGHSCNVMVMPKLLVSISVVIGRQEEKVDFPLSQLSSRCNSFKEFNYFCSAL